MAVELVNGDIVKTQIWCRDIEQASVNTVYFRITGITAGTPDTQDMAVQFNAVIKGPYVAWLTSQAEYRGVTCQDITQLPLHSPSGISSHQVGSAGAIGAPRQSAPLIKWQTGIAGPKGRGRIFIPFMSTDELSAFGLVASGSLPLLTSIKDAIATFTSFTNAGNSATCEHVLYHRATRSATPMESYTIDNKIATQKRRGSYGRANSEPV